MGRESLRRSWLGRRVRPGRPRAGGGAGGRLRGRTPFRRHQTPPPLETSFCLGWAAAPRPLAARGPSVLQNRSAKLLRRVSCSPHAAVAGSGSGAFSQDGPVRGGLSAQSWMGQFTSCVTMKSAAVCRPSRLCWTGAAPRLNLRPLVPCATRRFFPLPVSFPCRCFRSVPCTRSGWSFLKRLRRWGACGRGERGSRTGKRQC